MTVKIRNIGEEAVLFHVEGELVRGPDIREFRKVLEGFVGEYRKIVVDMGEVTKIDIAGAGFLLETQVHAATAGTSVGVYNFTNTVRDSLSLLKLLTVFEFYNS